jgi:hypothetical protein
MIAPGICVQAKLALLQSMQHDDIWIALYGKHAALSSNTTHYTPEGEVVGMGYERGGKRLNGINFGVSGSRAWIDWSEDPRWEVASISAAGAMIYNRSKNDLALCVLAFEDVITSKNGPWWLELPPPGETAVVRWA